MGRQQEEHRRMGEGDKRQKAKIAEEMKLKERTWYLWSCRYSPNVRSMTGVVVVNKINPHVQGTRGRKPRDAWRHSTQVTTQLSVLLRRVAEGGKKRNNLRGKAGAYGRGTGRRSAFGTANGASQEGRAAAACWVGLSWNQLRRWACHWRSLRVLVWRVRRGLMCLANSRNSKAWSLQSKNNHGTFAVALL